MLVKVLPSQAMKSNSPPAIRCAIGGSGAAGSAAIAAAGAGNSFASDEGAGVAIGFASDALEPVAMSTHTRNAAKIARLSFEIQLVTPQL
jgi:hypothetical protein